MPLSAWAATARLRWRLIPPPQGRRGVVVRERRRQRSCGAGCGRWSRRRATSSRAASGVKSSSGRRGEGVQQERPCGLNEGVGGTEAVLRAAATGCWALAGCLGPVGRVAVGDSVRSAPDCEVAEQVSWSRACPVGHQVGGLVAETVSRIWSARMVTRSTPSCGYGPSACARWGVRDAGQPGQWSGTRGVVQAGVVQGADPDRGASAGGVELARSGRALERGEGVGAGGAKQDQMGAQGPAAADPRRYQARPARHQSGFLRSQPFRVVFGGDMQRASR